MATQRHPYQSARLTYRAVEKEDDQAFIHLLQSDAAGFINSELALKKPQSKEDSKKVWEFYDSCLLSVVICVTEAQGDEEAGKPIGIINLQGLEARMIHHRYSEIGLSLLPTHQGKGYGSEAIQWVLQWAFDSANMHRVSVKAFEYNPGALRLYERLGFKHEGTIRETWWHNGRWWDDMEYGMLASEWRARQKAG